MTEQQEQDYYADHTLSVSSVRLFAQNPARALADWNGEYPWFDGDGTALELGRAFHPSSKRRRPVRRQLRGWRQR